MSIVNLLNCTVCHKEADECSFPCNKCKRPQHSICSGLPDSSWAQLKSNTDLIFVCTLCTKRETLFEDLTDAMKKLQCDFEALKAELNNLKQPHTSNASMEEVIAEIEEGAKKLTIDGVPESDSMLSEESTPEAALSIVKDVCGVDAQPNNRIISHLGIRKPEFDRPIQVTTPNKNMNQQIEARLHSINSFITLNKSERSTNAKNYDELRTLVIRKMKDIDSTFKRLFSGLTFAGSCADNLKISKPDEYDLDILLEIPQAEVHKDNKRPGFVKINLNKSIKYFSDLKAIEVVNCLSKLIDNQGYLLIVKFHAWIESIFVKSALNGTRQTLAGNSFELKYVKMSPAHTIFARGSGIDFSVDFVPGISFGRKDWPAKRPVPNNSNGSWCAIPRPIKGSGNLENVSFRTSFVEPESRLIDGKDTLKNTLRMIKKIRTNRNVNNIKSYYIKTVYLLTCAEEPASFWNRPASQVLSDMLGKLIQYLQKGNLPFFWDQQCNMLAGFNSQQISNMCGQMKAALRDYEAYKNGEYEKLLSVFLNEAERRQISG